MIKITRLLSIMLVAGVLLTSCSARKATKSTLGDGEVKTPCRNYASDKDYFRASSSANSSDLANSMDNALFAAKNKLAGLINTKSSIVIRSYSKNVKMQNNSEFSEKIEKEKRSVVSETLVDIAIICEKTFKQEDGSYTSFVAIECKKEALYNGLHNVISKNEKLRQDYDQQQFRKIFEEEMQKLEEAQP